MSHTPSYLGVFEVVGVSSGCLGLLCITSLLWFVGVVLMIHVSHSLAILLHVLCASGGVVGEAVCVLWLPRATFDDVFVVVCGCCPHDKLKL